MTKQEYLTLWGYLDILEQDYKRRLINAQGRASEATTPEDRERFERLSTDYTTRGNELRELKSKVQFEADHASGD